MKGYLKYFRVYFIIILALAAVFLILSIARAGAKTERAMRNAPRRRGFSIMRIS